MPFLTSRRVEFRDTDAAGIVHFSAFFPMMEAAEHEMLRALGLSVMPKAAIQDDGNHDADANQEDLAVTWPRIAAHCEYSAAARFEDLLEIAVEVVHVGSTSVRYKFTFNRGDLRVATGEITAVCCRLIRGYQASDTGQSGCSESSGGSGIEVRLEKTPIPDAIRTLLARYQ